MNDRRRTTIELAQKGYINAYRIANPGGALPWLKYENGWFRFLDSQRRVRLAELDRMTERLLGRVREDTADQQAMAREHRARSR